MSSINNLKITSMKTLRVLKYVGFGIPGWGFGVLAVFVTMSQWNRHIPAILKGPSLTFWQTAEGMIKVGESG
jgi:hypothetical protein